MGLNLIHVWETCCVSFIQTLRVPLMEYTHWPDKNYFNVFFLKLHLFCKSFQYIAFVFSIVGKNLGKFKRIKSKTHLKHFLNECKGQINSGKDQVGEKGRNLRKAWTAPHEITNAAQFHIPKMDLVCISCSAVMFPWETSKVHDDFKSFSACCDCRIQLKPFRDPLSTPRSHFMRNSQQFWQVLQSSKQIAK